MSNRPKAERGDIVRAKPGLLPPLLMGVLVVVIVFGGLLAWSMFLPLDGAVVAPANVQVESNRKAVQHLEGGIVADIRVREGDYVEAGGLLVRLDDAVDTASLALITGQLDEQLARRARLAAELDSARAFAYPEVLTKQAHLPRVAEILAGQTLLFEARRETRTSETELLRQRIRQLTNQIDGLQAQQESRQKQIVLLEQEILGLRQLYEKGFAPITRLLALERDAERLRGERGAHVAEIARVHNAIGEAELEIVRQERNFRESVITETREAQMQIVELSERRIAVEDRLRRRNVIAPRSGYVLNLQIHTIGGVISPGVPIMEIVPRDDRLVIAAQVLPQDIDKIQVGFDAVVRLTAFNQRTTPELWGKVKSVSGDRMVDASSGMPYYLSVIDLPAASLARLAGLTLVPGMPAEVFIRTGERSAISYLLKPLSDSFTRALRED